MLDSCCIPFRLLLNSGFATGGSLFLFNKRVLRFFRKDGHSWRKKRDGRTVGEAHERLKVLYDATIPFKLIYSFTFHPYENSTISLHLHSPQHIMTTSLPQDPLLITK